MENKFRQYNDEDSHEDIKSKYNELVKEFNDYKQNQSLRIPSCPKLNGNIFLSRQYPVKTLFFGYSWHPRFLNFLNEIDFFYDDYLPR